MRVYKRTYKDGRKSKDYYYSFYHEGKEIRHKGCSSARLTLKLAKQHERDLVEGKIGIRKAPLFNDVMKDFLEYGKINKESFKTDESRNRHLIAVFGGMRLNEISSFHIERYRSARKEIVSQSTINREISLLKAAINKQIQAGRWDKNPTKNIRKFDEPKIDKFLEEDEITTLLEVAEIHVRPIILTFLHTGMRRGELANLKWADVQNGIITIRMETTKTKKARYIPINSALRKCFNILPGHGEYIFIDGQKNRLQAGKKISRWIERTMRQAGIDPSRPCSTLRHTFASHMVMRRAPLSAVGKYLGHSTSNMTERYAHFAPDYLREEIEKIANLDTQLADKKLVSLGKVRQKRK